MFFLVIVYVYDVKERLKKDKIEEKKCEINIKIKSRHLLPIRCLQNLNFNEIH